jgi:hypothetical protein
MHFRELFIDEKVIVVQPTYGSQDGIDQPPSTKPTKAKQLETARPNGSEVKPVCTKTA